MHTIKLAAFGIAAVAGSFVAFGVRPDAIADFYRDSLTPAGFAVWCFGFVVATLSPPAVAIAFWSGAKRFRYGWLLHLLLMPAIYASVRGSVAVMLLAAGEPDSDSLTGWATDPAVLLMVICPVVYFLALGLTRLSTRRQLGNGT